MKAAPISNSSSNFSFGVDFPKKKTEQYYYMTREDYLHNKQDFGPQKRRARILISTCFAGGIISTAVYLLLKLKRHS